MKMPPKSLAGYFLYSVQAGETYISVLFLGVNRTTSASHVLFGIAFSLGVLC